MSEYEWIALASFVVAAIVMLLVTQTKTRVSWPGWLVPAVVCLPFAIWTFIIVAANRFDGYTAVFLDSSWGLQVWLDRLLCLTAAFYLLQNRARAAGAKSEVWVLATILTGGIGLLVMLAWTLHLERAAAAHEAEGGGGE